MNVGGKAGLILGTAALLGCGMGRTAGAVRIGLAGNFHDPIGAPMKRAAEMAVAEINADGGIRGRPIALVERDDYANADSAVRVANALYDSGVVAVIGHVYSGPTIAAAPVYNGGPDPVVEISPSASAPALSTAGSYTFRLCPSDLAHGAALADWAVRRLGFHRGAVLFLNDDYGRGVRQTFVERAHQLHADIVAADPYLGSAPTVGPYLDRLARMSPPPQFLLVAGYRDDAQVILTEARRRGLQATLLGGDGLEGIQDAGPIADGVYSSAAYLSTLDTPASQRFVAAYRRRYPGVPEPNQAAAGSYDALYLLRDVIARVGTSRRAIRNGLAAVGNTRPAFKGVSGTIAFDSLGDVPARQVYMGVVRNGAMQAANGQ